MTAVIIVYQSQLLLSFFLSDISPSPQSSLSNNRDCPPKKRSKFKERHLNVGLIISFSVNELVMVIGLSGVQSVIILVIKLDNRVAGLGGTPMWNRWGCLLEILDLTPKGDHLGMTQAFYDP